MRFPRVKAEGQSFYHCVSRVVDRRFIFQTAGHGSGPIVLRAFCSKAVKPWPQAIQQLLALFSGARAICFAKIFAV
jgi:hypothetical protein